MATQPFSPQELRDAVLQFDQGINHGLAPELVPRNQLYDALNVNLRGNFAHPRSYYRKRYLEFPDPSIVAAVNAGWVQGACIYDPGQGGRQCLIVSISGKLYQFECWPDKFVVTDVTIQGGQSTTATQCWLWQVEKWIVWNDGTSKPIFWRPNGGNRSNYDTALNFSRYNTSSFTLPAIGSTASCDFNDVTDLVEGDIVTLQNRGQFSVQTIAGATVTLLSISGTPQGQVVPLQAGPAPNFFWQHSGTNLPPGRMGAYGRGRVWMALTDGRQFVAGDLVGGSSGTLANNFLDAPLNITENLYLAGGGNFTVPSSAGEIRAMRFAASLDKSLGQGPLQVFTAKTVFSCDAPADRLSWQDVTNPIVTESLLAGGGLGQDSTIPVNGDTIMRSVDGMRSLILARREFGTWGNTPISHEVRPTFEQDSQDLLPWGSAVMFDNRLLMTAGAVLGPHGPYFEGFVPLNFDPVSTIAGKAPSIYDSRLWTGLNCYKVLAGIFNSVDRCFALSWNKSEDALEVYEILTGENPATGDNQTVPVYWAFETGTLNFGENDPRVHHLKRLMGGELSVDRLQGKVSFYVFFRPDQWPAWVPWAKWEECAQMGADGKPQFRPRMILPEPSSAWCDAILNRPLREGYTFRVRIEIVGHCFFKGLRLNSVTIPEPRPGAPICSPICP